MLILRKVPLKAGLVRRHLRVATFGALMADERVRQFVVPDQWTRASIVYTIKTKVRPDFHDSSVSWSREGWGGYQRLEATVLEAGYERVHTMTDYYDGPRKGIADFEGAPHLYESEWDDLADEYAPAFRLSPVEPWLFVLALESWSIWRRWESAFYEGRTTQETHPALPDERTRSDELEQILDKELRIDETNYVRAHGDFKPLDDPTWNGLGWRPLQVKWVRL